MVWKNDKEKAEHEKETAETKNRLENITFLATINDYSRTMNAFRLKVQMEICIDLEMWHNNSQKSTNTHSV